jgi:hypothetical protein
VEGERSGSRKEGRKGIRRHWGQEAEGGSERANGKLVGGLTGVGLRRQMKRGMVWRIPSGQRGGSGGRGAKRRTSLVRGSLIEMLDSSLLPPSLLPETPKIFFPTPFQPPYVTHTKVSPSSHPTPELESHSVPIKWGPYRTIFDSVNLTVALRMIPF